MINFCYRSREQIDKDQAQAERIINRHINASDISRISLDLTKKPIPGAEYRLRMAQRDILEYHLSSGRMPETAKNRAIQSLKMIFHGVDRARGN